MLLSIATAVVAAAGMFLVVLGVTAWVRPPVARRFLLGFAESPAKHYTELGIRIAIGAALIAASPSMAGTKTAAAAGWVLLGTTFIMFFVPWQSHRAFAERAVPKALVYLPAIGIAAAAAGAAVLWSLFRAGAA